MAWADDTCWENMSPLPNGFASAHNRAGTPCTERGELCGYLPSSLLPSFFFLDTVLCVECTLNWPQPDCHIHLQRRGITQRGKTVITGGREISVAYGVELYTCVANEIVSISIVLCMYIILCLNLLAVSYAGCIVLYQCHAICILTYYEGHI